MKHRRMNQLDLPQPAYNPIWPTHAGKHFHGYVKKAQVLVQGYTYSTTAHPDDEKLFNYLLNHAGFKRKAHYSVHVDAVMNFLGSHATRRSVAESLFRLAAAKIDIAGYEPDPESGQMKPWVGSFSRLEFKYSGIIDGTIIYSFSSMLRGTVDLIDPPAPFAMLNLNEIRQFKTIAGGRLYEWLSLKAQRKWDRSYEVSKEQFAMMLGDARYTQIGSNGHIVIPRWDNYTKHVVNPALQELREIAGFDVSVVFKRGNSQGRRIEAILLTVMKKGKESRWLLENEIPTTLHTKNMNLKAMQEDKLRLSRLRGAKATGLQRRYGKVVDGRKIVENRRDGTDYNGHDVWNEALDQECFRDWIESERRHANGVPEHRNHPPEPRKWRAMNAKNLELIQRELANDP
jgi:hypothetical protein